MYCERGDIEDVFGIQNVAKWADLDNNEDADAIDSRIARSIAYATARIDAALSGGVFRIPIANADATIPTLINDVAANLAGVWLYESRGVVDMDPEGRPQHRLKWARDNALAMLGQIQAGQLAFPDAVRVAEATEGIPLVVREASEAGSFGRSTHDLNPPDYFR